MYRIDEILPVDPLHAEVVLHVRRLLRARIRRQDRAASAIALLFGFDPVQDAAWSGAAKATDPMQEGARVAAGHRGTRDGVIPLGYDDAHVARCHQFLLARKKEDDVFAQTVATDLGTLLELSKAREMATAEGLDDDGEKRPLPVLIRGETGTGKELLARAIHTLSSHGKKDAPYRVIHVAGMTADMINAEIFGHAKGAFTDAKEARAGRIEEAHGGTVLIDEVGDLPDAAQLRLLRFLQTQRISRLGENREKKVRVRVIAATWHDLEKEAKGGKFRQDLLYRLRVGADLVLPPLRERAGVFEEVVPEILARRDHKARPPYARSTRDALALHDWQGNLRELVGVLEQALAVADGETLRVEHLSSQFQRAYLSLPLHERAPGFLSDEVEGQTLDDGHVAWRADEVARSLATLPLPDAHPEIEMVMRFLSMLDDSSPEHAQARADMNAFADLEREHRRSAHIAETWRRISGVDLPPLVRAEVQRRTEAASALTDRLTTDLAAARDNLHLEQHPWLALLKEAMESPLLANVDRNSVVTSFLAIFNVAKALAPKALEDARDAVRRGGFAALRDRVVAALKDHDDEGPREIGEGQRRPPGNLSRDEWLEISQHPTQASAMASTGYDPKTIAKYFAHHGISSPWKRAA